MLTVQNSGHLFQAQGVLLDSERAVDGADSVGTAKGRVGRKLTDGCESTNQFCDFYDRIQNGIGDLKGRIFKFHSFSPETLIFLLYRLL